MGQRNGVTIKKVATQLARIIPTMLCKIMDGVLAEMIIQQRLSLLKSLIVNVEVLVDSEELHETLFTRHVTLTMVRLYLHSIKYSGYR